MDSFERQAAGLKSNKRSLGIEKANEVYLSEWEGLDCCRVLHTNTGTGQRVVSIDFMGDGHFLPLNFQRHLFP